MSLLVLKIVGGLLLLDFLVQGAFARFLVTRFERKPHLRARSYPPRTSAGSFTVTTVDGEILRGSIMRTRARTPRGVLLFCHEFGGNRWSFQGHCSDDVFRHFDVVTFDFRNHGASSSNSRYSPSHWLTHYEVRDVEAVLGWIRSRPEWKGIPITLMGVSRGANAALAASRNVAGVVVVGAFSTHQLAFEHLMEGIRRIVPIILWFPQWHIRSTMNLAIAWSGLRNRLRYVSIERAASRLNCPVLMMAGGDDSHIPAALQRELATCVPGAEFWTVPGGRHNLERDAAPEAFDERLRQFLNASFEPANQRQPDQAANARAA